MSSQDCVVSGKHSVEFYVATVRPGSGEGNTQPATQHAPHIDLAQNVVPTSIIHLPCTVGTALTYLFYKINKHKILQAKLKLNNLKQLRVRTGIAQY